MPFPSALNQIKVAVFQLADMSNWVFIPHSKLLTNTLHLWRLFSLGPDNTLQGLHALRHGPHQPNAPMVCIPTSCQLYSAGYVVSQLYWGGGSGASPGTLVSECFDANCPDGLSHQQ